MKILTNKNTLIVCFFFLSKLLFSQGLVEVPLTTNKVLVQKWHEMQEAQSPQRGASVADTIKLPFLDDFSYESPYPDTALWLDKYVFINRGYPISPITIGVATFDGLNANGYPYDFNVGLGSSGQADYLTSKPINLKYPVSDSLYFSFYYQPQGRGNAPEKPDSLVLEFEAPGSNTWKHIWAKRGSTLASNDSSWKIVMIPITDTSMLKKGFQFRFRNYATLSGSWDHWNIDYVYLNKRPAGKNDTIFNNVSYVYNTSSLIKTYSSMPWNHYNSSFQKDTITVLLRDNDINPIPKNITFFRSVYDQSQTPVYSFGPSNDNVFSFTTNGYYSYKAYVPPLTLIVNNPTKYTFETRIGGSGAKDTIIHHIQTFSNYYSYDDGTAEIAFALKGTVGALLAEQYTSTITDTLRCIDIYFNPQGTNATLYTFRFKVWNDNGGKPGTAIYTSDTVTAPLYNQTGYDQFTRYYLRKPLYLNASKFYIGFQQNTDQFLGVGVDKNNNTQYQTFYNTAGTWMNSPYLGSLMMHPIFGAVAIPAGIDTYASKENSLNVYPNPANDKLFIRSNSLNPSQKIIYSVIDLFGRTILENTTTIYEYIDISTLAEGVYFIRTIDGIHVSTNKFIKVN